MTEEQEYTYPLANDDDIFATIKLDELQELIEDSSFYRHLLDNGVEAWDGYHSALRSFKENHNGNSFFLKSDPV